MKAPLNMILITSLVIAPTMVVVTVRAGADSQQGDQQGCFDYQNAYIDSVTPLGVWNSASEDAAHAASGSEDPMPSGYTEWTSTLNRSVKHNDWRAKMTFDAPGHPECGGGNGGNGGS